MSRTSYFNRTLLYKNITRFWPLWVSYLVIWIFVLPMRLVNTSLYYVNNIQSYDKLVLDAVSPAGVAMAFIFAVPFAMAVYSYQFSDGSAVMLHSLPVKREGLFLTNYLSGLLFFIVPNIIVFLVTLGCEAAIGFVNIRVLLIWLAAVCGLGLFFFSFASFCAQFTGSLLALPAFYFILNFLVVGLNMLIPTITEAVIFGYYKYSINTLSFLSPVYNLLSNVGADENSGLYGWQIVAAYAGVGAAFAAAALLLYRRHRAESAGELITVGFVKPVFKIGFSFCFALVLTIICMGFFGWYTPADNTWLILTLLMLLFGAIGYFAADMAVKKSFKVFGKRHKGVYVSLAAILLVMLGIRFDVLGIGTYVPDVSGLDHVYLNGYGTSDPEEMAEIIEFQQFIIDNSALLKKEGTDSSSAYISFNFIPKDDSKKTTRRNYSISLSNEASKQKAEEINLRVDAFVNTPERIIKSSFGEDFNISQIVSVSAEVYGYNPDNGLNGYESYAYYDEQVKEIAAAVLADINDGTMGRNKSYYYYEYYDDDSFVYSYSNADYYPEPVPAEPAINITLTLIKYEYNQYTGALEPVYSDAYFNVSEDCVYTYKLLEGYIGF